MRHDDCFRTPASPTSFGHCFIIAGEAGGIDGGMFKGIVFFIGGEAGGIDDGMFKKDEPHPPSPYKAMGFRCHL